MTLHLSQMLRAVWKSTAFSYVSPVVRTQGAATALPRMSPALLQSADFSSRSGGRRARTTAKKTPSRTSAMVPVEEAWVEVPDKNSGLSYWWNQQTNETTHIGAPRPTGATAMAVPPPAEAQSGGMMSGLGGVVAQGMAFGVGSSIAHHAVGAVANSFGGGHDDHGGDDSFDI